MIMRLSNTPPLNGTPIAKLCLLLVLVGPGMSLVSAQDHGDAGTTRAASSAEERDKKASDTARFNAALKSGSQLAAEPVVKVFATPHASAEFVAPVTKDSGRRRAEQGDGKPASGMKKLFKELRPGSCTSPPHGAPPSSWPARGEPAVAFCQP
jgi:hypothetical protein